jgi:hypothetical protein
MAASPPPGLKSETADSRLGRARQAELPPSSTPATVTDGAAAQVRYEGSVRSRRRSSPGQISVPRSRGLIVAPAWA